MKQIRIFTLCTILLMSTLFMTACGNNANDNTRQAPYEDEINNGGVINDGQNNNGQNNNGNNAGNNLKDAGQNLMDSIRDTGDAIRNGVDDITDMPNNDMDVSPEDTERMYGSTEYDPAKENDGSTQNGTYHNGMTNP